MNYAKFLVLLLAAKEHLPRLLSVLEKWGELYQESVNVVNLIIRAGQPIPVPARVDVRFSEAELAAESAVLKAIPVAQAAVSSRHDSEEDSPPSARACWRRQQRLFHARDAWQRSRLVQRWGRSIPNADVRPK